MPVLVAVDATIDPGFPERLQRVWGAGDAAFPVDPRLAPDAAAALVAAMGVGQPVDEGDALVVATSGSTGEPKGAVLTHHAVEASARITSAALAVDPGRDRWLACLPLSHIGGLSVVTRALITGTPLTLAPFDPAAVSAAAAAGCTLTSLVPTALHRCDVSGFRRVLVGGGADWRPLPANGVQTYGMTETGSGIAYDGGLLDGVDARADDAGQIWLRSPTLLRCYRDGTSPLDGDGWFPTADAGIVDGRTIAIHGRLDDAINTGGEKVWPGPVERALVGHPAVEDAVVVGVSDPEWGQRIVAAIVVSRSADRAPTDDELRQVVAAAVAPWAAPRQILNVATLPRTPLGKPDRAEVSRWATGG